jgi:cytochrome d ubiquinol oxidase subunit II
MLNSIGPVWDGNEVWLVLGGGVLFAAFPLVYASLFSGLYIAMMLDPARADPAHRGHRVSQQAAQSPRWRSFWDWVFFGASLWHRAAAGRGHRQHHRSGCPSTPRATSSLALTDLLSPYALLVGVTTIFMLATHGAIYLSMKAEGELLARIERWVPRLMAIFFVLNTLLVGATIFFHAHVSESYLSQPLLVILPGGWHCSP